MGSIGGALVTGLVPGLPTTQTTVSAVPALQPLPAQVTDNADMVITFSERFLNANLAQGIPTGGQVSNVQLDLHSGETADLHATVVINAFLTVQPKLALKLAVANGQVTIDVVSVDVGGFGLPSSLIQPEIDSFKSTAQTQLNQQLVLMAQTTGLKLQSVSTTENSLTLYFAP